MELELSVQDGLPAVVRWPLAGSSIAEQTGTATRFAEGLNCDIIRDIAGQLSTELEDWLSWANLYAGRQATHISLTLYDAPRGDYWARVACLSSGAAYRIDLGLGSIAAVLYLGSLIEEAIVTAAQTGAMRFMLLRDMGDFAKTGSVPLFLSPSGQPLQRLVVDAMLLMFLHEVSHAFGAHMLWAPLQTESLNRKAAETDADWGAGLLFMRRLFEQKVPPQVAAKRLYTSASLNHIALELNRVPSSRYHLPPQRLLATLMGAEAGARLSAIDLAILTQVQRDLLPALSNVLGTLPSQLGLKHDWFNDPAAVEDRQQFEQFTVPRVHEMRAEMGVRRVAPM